MKSTTHIGGALNLSTCALLKYTQIAFHHLCYKLNLLFASLKCRLFFVTKLADALGDAQWGQAHLPNSQTRWSGCGLHLHEHNWMNFTVVYLSSFYCVFISLFVCFLAVYYQCALGMSCRYSLKCLRTSQWCDGVADCSHGEDESNCCKNLYIFFQSWTHIGFVWLSDIPVI